MKPSFKLMLGGLALATCFTSLSATKASATCNDTPYLSTICWTASYYCPVNYSEANGQLLSITSNEALYSLLGNAYGGDGRSTFALPDLRGRAAIGAGTGPGLQQVRLGEQVGRERHLITKANMPSHSHSIQMGSMPIEGQITAVEDLGSVTSPANAFPAARSDGGGPASRKPFYTASTSQGMVEMAENSATLAPNPRFFKTESALGAGGDQGQETLPIRPPQVAVKACIATKGIYPTRD